MIWNISSLHTLRYKHIWLQRCVYTHSLYLWNLLKAFYRLGCPFAQASLPASHPVCPWSAQSANCRRLPRAIQAKTTSSWFRFQFFGGQHRHTYFCYRGIVQECLIASQILHGQFYSWQLNSLIILIGISKYIGQILDILVLNSLIFRNQYLEYNIPRNKESSLQFAGAATLNLRELDESSHPSFNSGLDIGALWSEL